MIPILLSDSIPLIKRIKQHLDRSGIVYRFARGAFWSLVGAFISRGLTLLASVAVARILGKVQYGELGMIQTTFGMFGMFAGLGLGITATKYVAEYRRTNPAKAGRIISLSLALSGFFGGIVCLILFLIAPWLSAHVLSAPQLKSLLQIGAGLLFFSAINGVQTGALAGLEAFKSISNINLIAGFLSFPLIAGGALIGGLYGAVAGLVASTALNCYISHVGLRMRARESGVPIGWTGLREESEIVWSYGIPAFLSGAIVGPVNWASSALLVNQPKGYAEMGVLNAANQWKNAILFLPLVLGQVLVPILSERISSNDGRTTRAALLYSIALNAVVLIPVTVIAAIGSRRLMALYGQGFEEAWPTLVVVVATAYLLAIQTPVGHVISAAGRMWMGFIMNMGWAVVTMMGVVFFIKYGALGVAAAQLIGYAVHAVWTLGYARRIIRSANV